jgi:hypothetical protein
VVDGGKSIARRMLEDDRRHKAGKERGSGAAAAAEDCVRRSLTMEGHGVQRVQIATRRISMRQIHDLCTCDHGSPIARTPSSRVFGMLFGCRSLAINRFAVHRFAIGSSDKTSNASPATVAPNLRQSQQAQEKQASISQSVPCKASYRPCLP